MMDELREKIIDAIGNTNIDNAFIKDIFDDSFIRKVPSKTVDFSHQIQKEKLKKKMKKKSLLLLLNYM